MCIIFEILGEFYGFSKICGHILEFAAMGPYNKFQSISSIFSFFSII